MPIEFLDNLFRDGKHNASHCCVVEPHGKETSGCHQAKDYPVDVVVVLFEYIVVVDDVVFVEVVIVFDVVIMIVVDFDFVFGVVIFILRSIFAIVVFFPFFSLYYGCC